MANLSPNDVKNLAKLTQIDLTNEELSEFSVQLDSILDHIKTINEVIATNNIENNKDSFNLNCVRNDEVKKGLSAEEALDQAPAKEHNQFKVPKILGE